LTRSQAQKQIAEGLIKINSVVVQKEAKKLQQGDIVTTSAGADPHRRLTETTTQSNIPPSILHEDDSCIVINKPADVVVTDIEASHPGLTLVHRLDKETTGCLLLAKNVAAHAELQKQFKDRTVKKSYLALVAGIPNPSEAMIDSPIGRNLTNRTKMSILKTSKSRDAQTTYRTLKALNDRALLECDLHTGRTHQIRVHLSSIGHPILGDPTYKSGASDKVSRDNGIENLCLHSHSLKFTSPSTGDIEVSAPEPEWVTALA
jgi:23S rRNA pseudouridine1911/1915/1917 synthase